MGSILYVEGLRYHKHIRETDFPHLLPENIRIRPWVEIGSTRPWELECQACTKWIMLHFAGGPRSQVQIIHLVNLYKLYWSHSHHVVVSDYCILSPEAFIVCPRADLCATYLHVHR